jgi:hypothetical protein
MRKDTASLDIGVDLLQPKAELSTNSECRKYTGTDEMPHRRRRDSKGGCSSLDIKHRYAPSTPYDCRKYIVGIQTYPLMFIDGQALRDRLDYY